MQTWTIDEAAPFGKKGAEGITFVPDEWLDKGDFVDGSGTPYRQSVGGMNGFVLFSFSLFCRTLCAISYCELILFSSALINRLFFIAHQNGGQLYAVDVSSDGSAVFAGKDYRVVGVFATSALESSALYFDRSIGHLYISHGIDGNSLEIANLISSAYQSSDTPAASRKLTRLALYAYPLLSNPEGMHACFLPFRSVVACLLAFTFALSIFLCLYFSIVVFVPSFNTFSGFATTPCKNAQGEFFNTSERWAFVANDCEVTETQECKDRSLLWYKNAAFLCKDFPASPAEDDGDDDWVWFLVGGVGLVAILSVVMIYSFWDKLPACCMRFCCCCKCCPKQKKQQKAASALLAGCGTTDSTPVSGSSNSNGALPAGFNGYSYSFAPNAASPAYAAPLLPSTTFVSP